MFSADSAFHAAALIHLDYCLVDQRSPFQNTLQMKLAALTLSFRLLYFFTSPPFLLLGSLPLLLSSYFLSFHLASLLPLLFPTFLPEPPTATPELPHPLFHVLSSSSSSGLPPDRQLTTDCPPNESEVATGRLAESVLLIYIEMSHIFPGYCG